MDKVDKIQEKIWKAYGKVSNILGRPFNVYRSSSLSSPLTAENWVYTTMAAFSKDEKFKRPQGSGLPLWYCWVDGRYDALFTMNQGDYLWNEETGDTFFIATTDPVVQIQAIKCTHTISVYGTGYTNTSTGFGPGEVLVADSVPCSIQQPSSTTANLGYIPTQTHLFESVPTFEINLWDPQNEIKRGMRIVDNAGMESTVVSTHRSEMGTKIITKATEPLDD